VIKVERPGTGDDTRTWGPPWLKDRDGQDTRDSAYYLCANRNKRSIAVDFTRPEGQRTLRELAKTTPGRMGNAHPNTVPYQDFPTADGYMIPAIGNDRQFGSFCKAVGRTEWAQHERFRSNTARVRNRAILIPLMKQLTVTRDTREWIALLETVGVPCGPINSIAEVFADPQVQARGTQMHMRHPLAGRSRWWPVPCA
jgi:crotonobetainyl-CoA:carnitine CoA-transferase CaiB-like acyl-CoA transferase